ncbi:MAG: hypothetical protein M1608_02005 [Candidatus Omnitrophica bacterium]|nr:hypothetical protein [Candidatus Omnitrophota bacterium]
MRIERHSERGQVLLVTLGVSAVIGMLLVSYLQFLGTQYRATVRSQAWNMALPVAEAGIEEALTHLYYNGPSNLETNGWTLENGQFVKDRSLGEDHYRVTITGNNSVVIVSQGFTRLPISTNFLSRKIRVTARRSALLVKAMVAKEAIDMHGNSIRTDSFDSTNPNYSTGGRYDRTKARANGDVATNSGLVNSLNLGNANIWGHVATGPGGSVSVGPNGAVGDVEWQTTGQHGVKPGWSTDDMNVSFPDVAVPFTGGYSTPSRQQVGNAWVDHVISSSGNWLLPGLSGSLLVRSNVNAVLLVTGDISISGKDYIQLESGSSLKLYMQGEDASIKGLGVVNTNANATNFFYYGLPGNTSLAISGNGQFTGVIYAPNADFTLSGGGNDTQDFTGASVTETVNMNGHFNFHYDENLGRLDNSRGYIVTSWNEIPVSSDG